jgi:hypothetical protein
MEIYFKEGDLASEQGLGNATIIGFRDHPDYPVMAKFQCGTIGYFTHDGKYAKDCPYPSLLQGHNRFDPNPNKPIFEPKYGELVWAKVCNSWIAAYYHKYKLEDNLHLVFFGLSSDPLVQVRNLSATEIRSFKGEIPND